MEKKTEPEKYSNHPKGGKKKMSQDGTNRKQIAGLKFYHIYNHIEECWSLSGVRLFATRWADLGQAPLSTGFSRQEHWSG